MILGQERQHKRAYKSCITIESQFIIDIHSTAWYEPAMHVMIPYGDRGSFTNIANLKDTVPSDWA